MKIMKKIICLISIVLVLFNMNTIKVFACNEVPVDEREYESSLYDECNNANENQGEKAFGQLIDFLSNNAASYSLENVTDNEYSDFWDCFGGSYIDDNGRFIVYTTKEYDNLIEAANIEESAISFVKTDLSYENLKAQQIEIWDVRNELLNGDDEALRLWANKIISVTVSQKNNCVMIFANGFEQEDYTICNIYFGDKKYIIEPTNSQGSIIPQTTIAPGQSISTGSSVGFRCKYNGSEGFITTVHTEDYSKIGRIKDGNGNYLGDIQFSIHDGSADFCFVKTVNDTYVSLITNTAPAFTLNAISSITYLPEGYTVFLAGGTSVSPRIGKVISFDYSISTGNSWCICSYSSNQGDSGGCVFAEVNGNYCVLGIHDGRVDVPGNGENAYVTKFSTMQQYYSNLQFYQKN